LECALVVSLAPRVGHLPVVALDGEVIGLLNDADVWAHGVTTFGADGRPIWTWHRDSDGRARIDDLMAPVEVLTRRDEGFAHLIRRWKGSRQDAAIVVDWRRHLLGIVTEHREGVAGTHLIPASAA